MAYPLPVLLLKSVAAVCLDVALAVVQAAAEPVAVTREEVTPDTSAQVDGHEAAAPVVAPKPAPMTTQQIAAYRSGEDPDFDPVERRGWWEVDLTSGCCTFLRLQVHCCSYHQCFILVKKCFLCCLVCWCVCMPK